MIRVLSMLTLVERAILGLGLLAGWGLLLPIIVFRFFDIIAKRHFDPPSRLIQVIEWDAFYMLIFIALAFGYLRDGHARIDILRDRFSPRLKAWAEIWGVLLLLLPFCILVVVWGVEYVRTNYANHDTWWVPGVNLWAKKAFVPFGIGLLALAGLLVLIRNIIFVVTDRGGIAPERLVGKENPEQEPGGRCG